MYLRFYLDDKGERVYTLSTTAPDGSPTMCAHPARFNPKDTYSEQRIRIKARFGLLPTQNKVKPTAA